ncbi:MULTISPECIES: PLD nuclease N-terminal domain-containing protein [unclassified Oceanobacillus]|uniref:PLD nuclease N-terminal domain-containing protein n=1 Tax=unclassified Oceanobacillus TaxID=2630292 RepID=UPI001BE95882|nr:MULTISPECIES: PLD nuclease N-terminal domain-containing protein [unclassified Oceanobacillus]MBT2601376.1 PLDc_N domain-containing protein [Oceanobacillus sp. ISL-74]MBT2653458.1 PLDc_N domain-containing protein [Oceanobacillus sp. ISL-73]
MEELLEYLPIILPFVIIQIILMIIALIDWSKNKESFDIMELVWLIVIIFLNIFGPIIYFLFARRNNE